MTLQEKIDKSISILKENEPSDGGEYVLAFSGGKDSIVCYYLLKQSGIKYRAIYSNTTIDPPEIPKFIRSNFPDCEIAYPHYKGERTNFYKLVEKKGLPSRMIRWCCAVLKENTGEKGDTVVIGVRAEESRKRAKNPVTNDYLGKHMVRPILEWTTEDVWEYIHTNNLPYPKMYDNGHNRIGCIMCPLACRKAKIRDYEEYPKHVRALESALAIFLKDRPNSGLYKWGKDPHEILYYWVHDAPIESAKGPCMQNTTKDDNK